MAMTVLCVFVLFYCLHCSSTFERMALALTPVLTPTFTFATTRSHLLRPPSTCQDILHDVTPDSVVKLRTLLGTRPFLHPQ